MGGGHPILNPYEIVNSTIAQQRLTGSATRSWPTWGGAVTAANQHTGGKRSSKSLPNSITQAEAAAIMGIS
jgi:hypothetical protein